MRSSRSFALLFAISVAFVAAGCSDDAGDGSGGGTGGGATGQGGEVGQGGAPAGSTATVGVSSVASVASSSASTGGGPINCPLGGYATFEQSEECDMLQQNCEPGFTCVRTRSAGSTVTACEARGGLKGVASACEEDAECESGLFCVFNVCTPVCCPDTEEPCGGGNCNLTLTFPNDGDAIVVCTYSKQCEPLTEEACPSGSGCHFEEATVSTCIQNSGSNVPEGGDCDALNDCGNMQQCAGSGICRWICSMPDNGEEPGLGGCPSGQSCVETPIIGVSGIGICDPS